MKSIEQYSIRNIGEWSIVERIAYPRLRFFISYRGPFRKLQMVRMLEYCSSMEMVKAIEEFKVYHRYRNYTGAN
jgi:hypothetical protein